MAINEFWTTIFIVLDLIPNVDIAHEVAFLIVWGALFLLLLFIGRMLRKRGGLSLGITYKFFSAACAIKLPLMLMNEEIIYSRWLDAVLVVSGAFVLSAIIGHYFWEVYFSQKFKTPAPRLFAQLSTIMIVGLAGFMVLTWWQDVSTFKAVFASSGVIAIILGLAMQDLLGNLVAGLSIFFGKPFKIGDWLVLEGQHVQTVEINWRSSRFRTNDDIYLDVPNSTITKQTITNLSYRRKTHAMRFHVGIDYRTPPNVVKESLKRATVRSEGVLKNPEPKVFLVDFGDSAINYEVKFWMEDQRRYNDICDEIRTHVWYELKRENVNIPFPIRTVEISRPNKVKDHHLRDRAKNLIAEQTFFEKLSKSEIDTIAECGRISRFAAGENFIRQGDAGDSMFLLLHGSAIVIMDSGQGPAEIGSLLPGHSFGETSLLTGKKRVATVRARVDCEVLELCNRELAGLMKEHPEIVERLGDVLVARNKKTAEVLERLHAQSASESEAVIKPNKQNFLRRLRGLLDV